MQSGNQAVVSKACATADLLTYRCGLPVDAASYIGVTFDISEGYNSQGLRGKLVKHWCREQNKYKVFLVAGLFRDRVKFFRIDFLLAQKYH